MFKKFLISFAVCILAGSTLSAETPVVVPTYLLTTPIINSECVTSAVAAGKALYGVEPLFKEFTEFTFNHDGTSHVILQRWARRFEAVLKSMPVETAKFHMQRFARFLDGETLHRVAATALISEMGDFILENEFFSETHPQYERVKLILRAERPKENLTFIVTMLELSIHRGKLDDPPNQWLPKFRKNFRHATPIDQLRALETIISFENQDSWLVPEMYELFMVGSYHKNASPLKRFKEESDDDWKIREAKWHKENYYGYMITALIRTKFPFSEDINRAKIGMGMMHNPYEAP